MNVKVKKIVLLIVVGLLLIASLPVQAGDELDTAREALGNDLNAFLESLRKYQSNMIQSDIEHLEEDENIDIDNNPYRALNVIEKFHEHIRNLSSNQTKQMLGIVDGENSPEEDPFKKQARRLNRNLERQADLTANAGTANSTKEVAQLIANVSENQSLILGEIQMLQAKSLAVGQMSNMLSGSVSETLSQENSARRYRRDADGSDAAKLGQDASLY